MNGKIELNDERIIYLKNRDKRLAQVFELIGDLSFTIHIDGYSFIIEEIVEQMLSKKAANKIRERLYTICAGKLTPESISGLTVDDLRGIGISRGKSQYILNFNDAITSKDLVLEELEELEDDAVMKRLMHIKGIGSWTAKMYLIFVLQREDVLPYEDGAFLQAYRWLYNTEKTSAQDIIKQCKCWHPYSSIAARFLYRALDEGYTKKLLNSIWQRMETTNGLE